MTLCTGGARGGTGMSIKGMVCEQGESVSLKHRGGLFNRVPYSKIIRLFPGTLSTLFVVFPSVLFLSSAVRSLGFAVQPNRVLRVPLCVAIGVPLPPLLLLHLFVT